LRRIAAHRRWLVIPPLAVALLIAGGLWLRDSPVVSVSHVEIVGARGPDAARVRGALAAAAKHMTTLHVRRDVLLAAVRSYPTVRDVRTDRDLLHGLRITVIGRPAVAALTVGAERLPVAADGTLLRGSPVPGDVPLVKLAMPPAGKRLRDPRGDRVLATIAAAPAAMRAHVARAYLGRQGLEAALRNGPSVILGDGRRLRAKWVAAARVLGDPGARGARYVDVRVPERAVAGGLPVPAQEQEGQPSTSG